MTSAAQHAPSFRTSRSRAVPFAIALLMTSVAVADDLTTAIEAIRSKHDVPTLFAAAIGTEGLIESTAVGTQKRGSKATVTTDHVFAIGSNSKAFTSTLAAALVDDGVINWNTTISETWPDQPVNKGFADVTLRQLLAHGGGLPENLPSDSEWGTFIDERFEPHQERQRMCAIVLTKPPTHPVGTYSYSNLGYVVAAAMLEERTEKTFEDLMQARIFDPLEMTNTAFYDKRRLKRSTAPLLWGHHDDGTAVRPGTPGAENPTVYAPCGTIRTTLDDYAKFLQWHLTEQASPLLKNDETAAQLHQAVVDRGPPGQTYGYGWILFEMGDLGRVAQHAGNNTNQFTLVWLMPEKKLATIAFTSTSESQAFTACNAATVVLMQRNPQ